MYLYTLKKYILTLALMKLYHAKWKKNALERHFLFLTFARLPPLYCRQPDILSSFERNEKKKKKKYIYIYTHIYLYMYSLVKLFSTGEQGLHEWQNRKYYVYIYIEGTNAVSRGTDPLHDFFNFVNIFFQF